MVRVAVNTTLEDFEVWADPATLAKILGFDETNPPTPEEQELINSAVAEATYILSALTGGVLHGEQCWEEDYVLRHGCEIDLLRGPVMEILGVSQVHECSLGAVDDDTPLDEWCAKPPNTVSFCCGTGSHTPRVNRCSCGDTIVHVTYHIGSNLPPGTETKTIWLANEIWKGAQGLPCKLPERVTSISRQGVSWTLMDTQDYLEKGLTGIGTLDSWLSAVKRAQPSATLTDPLKSYRIGAHQVDCPVPSP